MPIFEFHCDKCTKQEDKLISRTEADEGVSFDCDCEPGAKLTRGQAISAASLRFKGRWSSTTGDF